MCKKIVLVVPLVLVLSLVVSVSTSAPGKVALTDAQMSSVYGGGKDCRICVDRGCEVLICIRDCSDLQEWWDAGCDDDPLLPDCYGTWYTSCDQEQLCCGALKPSGSGGCTIYSIPCTGTYELWTCGLVGDPPECEGDLVGAFACILTKVWCVEN